jgi:hypothetical protein
MEKTHRNNGRRRQTVVANMTEGTIAPIQSQPTPAQAMPEFVRLPRTGTKEFYTDLNRSAINSVILPTAQNGNKPPVKSVCLRNPGSARGIRLVHLASLLNYVHQCGSGLEGGSR